MRLTQCEAPSHPELLDWLACSFMENGWSIKHLHRLIVGSATYRQSSHVTPEHLFQPPASYAPFPWKEEIGDERYRRARYTLRRRTTPYPVLQTYDAPEGNSACVRRLRSNTPLQALIGLNESISMDAARSLPHTYGAGWQ